MLMRIKSKTQDSDDKIREKMIIYAFRQVFHDSAVLYQDGKEQYNGTKYEFDLQNIRNLTKNKHDGFENDIYCDKPLLSKTNGNVFLLFYSSSYSSTDMKYQIVTYKDITDVLKRSQILFFQAGALTLGLLLFTGFLLFFSPSCGRCNHAAYDRSTIFCCRYYPGPGDRFCYRKNSDSFRIAAEITEEGEKRCLAVFLQ